MLKQIMLASAVLLAVGCSGSSDNPTPTTPANPDANPVPTNPPTGGTNPGVPTGTVVGTWAGLGDFGSSVYIIDSAQNLYGFSSDGAGNFKSLFGVITSPIERFDHRTSVNPAFGDAFTVVGDSDPNFPSVAYSFSVSADGLTMTNDSDFGSFSMSLAQNNPITIADVVGNWESNTSFCDTCPLTVTMNIAASGAVTGDTSFGLQGALDPATSGNPLSGTLSDAGQFLGIQFNWDGKQRTGVIYRDIGTQKIILNSFGFESAQDGNKSFSAIFTQVQ